MEIADFIGKQAKTIIVAKNQGTSEEVVISVDVVISEDQNYENEISSYPIEKGFDISDNVLRKPDTITLNVFVTNHPINQLGTALRGGNNIRVQKVYEDFVRIAGRTKSSVADFDISDFFIDSSIFVCTLYTTHRIYHDMFLESLSIPKNVDSGDALEFSAKFVRIHFVDEMIGGLNNSKNVPAATRNKTQATKTKPAGGKTTTGTVGLQSVIDKMFRFFGIYR